MSLMQFFRRKGRDCRDRDLFGQALPPSETAEAPSCALAADLRRLSEDALGQGHDRASCLIEMAAMIVELEDAYEGSGETPGFVPVIAETARSPARR